MENNMTQEQATELANALYALGIEASAGFNQRAVSGAVVKAYNVEATIRDAKSGNMVARRFTEAFDAAKVAKEMQKDIKARAKETRAHKRAERSVNRS